MGRCRLLITICTKEAKRLCLALSRCRGAFMESNAILGSLTCAHVGCWERARVLRPLRQPRAPTVPIGTRAGI